MQTLWPLFGIQANQAELRQHEWLNSTQALHMEIGFGMGHSLVQMAQQNPHICYFGIEVHSPGVGHILRQLHQLAISNVRIFHADVAQVLPLCPPACLDRVYLLFPDPWPKKRHLKRRLVQIEFIQLLASRMRPQGKIHLATDSKEYAQHMQAVAAKAGLQVRTNSAHPNLKNQRPGTKYALRAARLGNPVWDIEIRVSA